MTQVRLIISEGKIAAFVDGGTFEEAEIALQGLIADLGEIDISFENGEPEIEKHVHGPDDVQVRSNVRS